LIDWLNYFRVERNKKMFGRKNTNPDLMKKKGSILGRLTQKKNGKK
jgi:hypothetical protein